LISERSRLNILMSNLQSMQNERERQENETRRRSLQETERLEREVQTLKTKLSEEEETTKRLSARREFESRELQERVDKATAELSSAREQLAAATTARDQLQTRVEEYGILLKSSEEKIAALSKPDSAQDVNHEQQLGVEVADLKKSLELTKAELREAKEYAEKMKEIAATSEEALAEMNSTHDNFKESIDQQLAEKDVRTQF
jgi:nucleoprotein TPR